MAKRKQTKQRKQIKRTTRHFQLRTEHPQDNHVAEILDYAKSQRREVTVIREAVALYWALENGNLEALFEKFPAFRAQFAPDTALALAQFMEILKNQQQATPVMQLVEQGAQRVLTAAPVAVIGEAKVPSAEEMVDDFLSKLSLFD